MNELYFNTINDVKVKEITEIFGVCEIEIKFLNHEIYEILSEKLDEVIKAKTIAAYQSCSVPVVVEHGALEIDHLNGFPGALSKPMWNILGEKICQLIPSGVSRTAKAFSAVGYCDGKIIKSFIAHTNGIISESRKGTNGFQWDPIFIPDGVNKTYAEMSREEKLKFSQAKKAYDKLKQHLNL